MPMRKKTVSFSPLSYMSESRVENSVLDKGTLSPLNIQIDESINDTSPNARLTPKDRRLHSSYMSEATEGELTGCAKFCMQWNRIFHWKVSYICPNRNEEKVLDRKKIPPHRLLRCYILWRKTALKVALPLLFLTVVANFALQHEKFKKFEYTIEIPPTEEQDVPRLERAIAGVTQLGKVAITSRTVIPNLIWCGGTFLSVYVWLDLKLSIRVLYITAILAQLSYFWPVLIQSSKLYSPVIEDDESELSHQIAINLKNGMRYFFDIVPILVGFPKGAFSAAMSMFGLVERSKIPGVLVMYFAPFSTMIVFFSCSGIAQVFGDWLFAIATIFFVLSDMMVFTSYELLFKGRSDIYMEKKVMRNRLFLNLIGLAFLIFWFLRMIWPCLMLSTHASEKAMETFQFMLGLGSQPNCIIPGTVLIEGIPRSFYYSLLSSILGLFANIFVGKVLFSDLIRKTIFICEGEEEYMKELKEGFDIMCEDEFDESTDGEYSPRSTDTGNFSNSKRHDKSWIGFPIQQEQVDETIDL